MCFYCRLKTKEADSLNAHFDDSIDGLGVLLLVIAFNSVIFVGPALRFIYDSIVWCSEKHKISEKNNSNKNWLSSWCAEGMVSDGVNSNQDNELNAKLADIMEEKSEGLKNRTNSNSSSMKNKSSQWMKRGELNETEFVDEENYIMKSSSSSFASSNRLDDSLSNSSQEVE